MSGRFLLLLLLPCSMFAQNIELGLAGGISTNSSPSSNMIYKFDKWTPNYAGSIKLLYNFSQRIQGGIESQVLELSGISHGTYPTGVNTFIGNDNKRFVYAKKDVSFCAIVNGRANVGRGYVYAGLALGYSFANTSPDHLSSKESYQAPDGGKGIVAGGQLGYIVGITGKLGAYIECSIRYYDLKYNTSAPELSDNANLHYHIVGFPVLIGIRYRILNTIMYNFIPKSKGDNGSPSED